MMITQQKEPTPRKPLRFWPGVVVAVLVCAARFLIPILVPEALMLGVISALVGALAIVVWWLFFSRALWSERLGTIVLMGVALFTTSQLVHVSIRTGMMGMMLGIYAIPVLCLVLVAWAVASRRQPPALRRASLVAAILIACVAFLLVRTEGVTGGGASAWKWRWTKTPEQRLLAQTGAQPVLPMSFPPGTTVAADWPGFRGPSRDSIVRGIRIETDWSRSPPVELWCRPIGPGWSSFAVRGDVLYTQEQRGEEEVVACYKVLTGEPVWRHGDAVRFWESNAGAGPRATPTLSNGRVYSFGATGILNALDAGNGRLVWSRDTASDGEVKVPMWGFASSPLVIEGVVIVAAAGKLIAYHLDTGKPRWSGPARGGSYSSPHRLTIGGAAQVLLLSNAGATSVTPAEGALLWEHTWRGAAIVQPALAPDGDILISTGGPTGGLGIRRLGVRRGPGGWTTEERWTSAGLKPYYNDLVVHKGHGFGFDGSILACIDLKDGKRQWKGGRYGNGQLVLLADQDLLLVLSEQGELALVAATPEQFRELARCSALHGKTWNHPALADDVLLVRNGEEMSALRLRVAGH